MQTTLLLGGTVVSFSPFSVERRDLIVSGGTFANPEDGVPTTSVVDCRGCLLFPGLVVGHTHLYSALATGMPAPSTPPTSFKEILERVWWRLDRALDRESIRVSALWAAAQAAKRGVSCLFDHHESPGLIEGSLDLLKDALGTVGLRGVLCYGATNRNGDGDADRGLEESRRFAEKTRGSPKIRGLIGLHAPFTCSDGTISRALELSRGSGLHLHAAEGPDDQAEAMRRHGRPLIRRLSELGALGPKTLLAHAVHLGPDEVQQLAISGTWISHQARSNMNNAVGYASRLSTLGHVALGTDGIDNDILRELQTAFFRAREDRGPSAWPDPVEMLSRGHALASTFLGQSFGGTRPGDPADVSVFAYEPGTPIDEKTLGAHLVFGFSSAELRDLFVAGRPVVRNRKLVNVDEVALAEEAREAAQKLWARMGKG